MPALARRVREYDELFELTDRRAAVARRAWQAATGQPDVSPDRGELLAWLMERAGIPADDGGLMAIQKRQDGVSTND